MRKLIVATLALVVVAVIVAITLPVRLVDRVVELPEALDGFGGTLWNGRAIWRQPQQPPLEVNWRWRAPADWAWEAQGGATAVSGILKPATGGVRLESVRGTVATERVDLGQWLAGTRALGRFELDLDHFEADGANGPDIAGRAVWTDAELVGRLNARLGRIEVIFAAAEGVLARFESLDPAEVRVEGEIIQHGPDYELNARLIADPDRPDLAEALQRIGEADADGGVRIRYRGPLGL